MQKEKRQFLSRPDVQVYLLKYPDITVEEKRELVKWLKAGNSPSINNCNLSDDRGYPLDFIDARRTMADLIQQHIQMGKESGELFDDSVSDSFELPF